MAISLLATPHPSFFPTQSHPHPPGHTLPHPSQGQQVGWVEEVIPLLLQLPRGLFQVQPLTTSTQQPPLIGLIYSAEQHFVIADNAAFPAPLPFHHGVARGSR